MLAKEMLDLCETVFPKMLKDMLRIALMRPYDFAYYKNEFCAITEDYADISLLRSLVLNPDRWDWGYLKLYWRDLRNVVAKYNGNPKDPRIAAIDKHFSLFSWGLPKINPQPRPTKALPREWWDSSPMERQDLIATVAESWWFIYKPLDLEFEHLDINNRRFEDMEDIECLGSKRVHSINPTTI